MQLIQKRFEICFTEKSIQKSGISVKIERFYLNLWYAKVVCNNRKAEIRRFTRLENCGLNIDVSLEIYDFFVS